MNVLISQQSFSQINLTSNYPDLRAHSCLAPARPFGGQQRTKPGSASITKNNGPQRHIAALITTPNGKRPAHNCFEMQANGNRIYDYSREAASKHINVSGSINVGFSVSIQCDVTSGFCL